MIHTSSSLNCVRPLSGYVRDGIGRIARTCIIIASVLAVLLVAGSSRLNAQGNLSVSVTTPAHSATLSWTTSSTVGANYHVWRAPCTVALVTGVCPIAGEGSFLIVGTPSTTTFTDSTVVGNTTYSYYVTAFCPTGGTCASNFNLNADSPQSNHVGAAVPGDPVGAPGGLTITNTAKNYSDGNETLTASWYKQSTPTTSYTLIGSTGTLLSQGQLASSDGRYTYQWTGPVQHLILRVCDPQGRCASKVIS